jgi:hypothetical protein
VNTRLNAKFYLEAKAQGVRTSVFPNQERPDKTIRVFKGVPMQPDQAPQLPTRRRPRAPLCQQPLYVVHEVRNRVVVIEHAEAAARGDRRRL